MASPFKLTNPIVLLIVALILGVFMYLTFNERIGNVYWMLLLIVVALRTFDKRHSITIWNRKRQVTHIIEGLAALALFLIVSTLLLRLVAPAALVTDKSSTQAVFDLFSTGNLLLSGSIVLTYIGYAFYAAPIETIFVGSLLDIFKNTKVVGGLAVIVLFTTFLLTVLHFQAKGVTNVAPLATTFVFFLIQSLLILRHKDMSGAITMHVITNFMAIASSFGHFGL